MRRRGPLHGSLGRQVLSFFRFRQWATLGGPAPLGQEAEFPLECTQTGKRSGTFLQEVRRHFRERAEGWCKLEGARVEQKAGQV